jgi:hypothetical protein
MHRILFIGLWCLADKEGRLEDRPKRIKIEIFPYDNYDAEKGLIELEKARFILRYKGNANSSARILSPEQPVTELAIIQIINFSKYQRISGKENQGVSRFPPPPDGYPREAPGKHPGSTREAPGKLPGSLEYGDTDIRSTEYGIIPDSASPEVRSGPDPEAFKKFQAWILKNTPTVAHMKEPFTQDQFERLFTQRDPALVKKILGNMHNYKPLRVKNTSAYLTCVNWYDRDQKKSV